MRGNSFKESVVKEMKARGFGEKEIKTVLSIFNKLGRRIYIDGSDKGSVFLAMKNIKTRGIDRGSFREFANEKLEKLKIEAQNKRDELSKKPYIQENVRLISPVASASAPAVQAVAVKTVRNPGIIQAGHVMSGEKQASSARA